MESVFTVWIVIAAVLVVVAVFLVRALIEIRATVIAARGLVTRIDTELVPVVKDLQGVLADLKVTTEGIASRVDDVKSAMTAVGDTGRNVTRINAVIGNVADLLTRITLVSTGVKAAGQYVCDRISRKRG
ncbi:MAG TPA: DUF948 domain-containing protein [Geobacteraceae bacterium]|jgi:uncharacterized protein YoxC|nr:DUF948 domain-containing protein [Geobacteraceae bacterium]